MLCTRVLLHIRQGNQGNNTLSPNYKLSTRISFEPVDNKRGIKSFGDYPTGISSGSDGTDSAFTGRGTGSGSGSGTGTGTESSGSFMKWGGSRERHLSTKDMDEEKGEGSSRQRSKTPRLGLNVLRSTTTPTPRTTLPFSFIGSSGSGSTSGSSSGVRSLGGLSKNTFGNTGTIHEDEGGETIEMTLRGIDHPSTSVNKGDE